MCPAGYIKTAATKNDFNFECEQCPSRYSPNQDQTECLICDPTLTGLSPNILERNAAGECVCEEGYKVVEIGSLGRRATTLATDPTDPSTPLFRCELCPANTYRGPAITSIWECEPCPHPDMEYNSGNIC